MLTFGQIFFRLIFSAILCGLIGLEREFKHKPAGLRTNILVGVGSTLIMLISIYMGQLTNSDWGKIAGGVILGAGFLGAGVIIKGQPNEQEIIHGLTTAVTIWIVSAIGLAIGIGFYFGALIATVIILVTLFIFSSDKFRAKIKLP